MLERFPGGSMKLLNILIFISFILFLSCSAKLHENSDHSRTVSVDGIATYNVTPDRVKLSLGVETYNIDVKIARQTTKTKIDQFVNDLIKLGLTKDDIIYDFLRISPKYQSMNYGKKIEGYNALLNITIRLSDFTKINDVIDTGVENGITSLGTLNFYSSKMTEHKKKVREMALDAAKDKAKQIAEKMNVTLGKLISVSERSSSDGSRWSWDNRLSNTVNYSSTSSYAVSDISTGKIPLRLTVDCMFEIN